MQGLVRVLHQERTVGQPLVDPHGAFDDSVRFPNDRLVVILVISFEGIGGTGYRKPNHRTVGRRGPSKLDVVDAEQEMIASVALKLQQMAPSLQVDPLPLPPPERSRRLRDWVETQDEALMRINFLPALDRERLSTIADLLLKEPVIENPLR